MILQSLDRLNDSTWKMVGYIILAFLLGFAAGNGHTTDEALKGQAQYFQRDEHVKIKQHVQLQRKQDVIEEKTKGAIAPDNK